LAKQGINDQHLVKPLLVLPSVAHDVAEYRRRRNAIVHDVSTRMAHFVGATVSRLQQRYDREKENRPESKSPKKNTGLSRVATRRKEIEIEIDRATDELHEWYTLLIQASNAVFQVEYWTRRYDASQTRRRGR